jgi:hypothetical protein
VEAPVETLPLRRLTVFYIDREYPRKRRIATALVLVRWQGKALWYTLYNTRDFGGCLGGCLHLALLFMNGQHSFMPVPFPLQFC